MLIKIDEVNATTMYIGRTQSGNSTVAPVWSILKYTVSGTITDFETPLGVPKGSAVWDDRASYTYG